jgi:hypothetical protein
MKLPASINTISSGTGVEAGVAVDRTGEGVGEILDGVSVACKPPSVSGSPAHAPNRSAEVDIPVSFRTSRRESFLLILMIFPLFV